MHMVIKRLQTNLIIEIKINNFPSQIDKNTKYLNLSPCAQEKRSCSGRTLSFP